ncbi:MAG: DUF6597 domain-containing transcriptional factor, partial [Chitinophagales bacterium]
MSTYNPLQINDYVHYRESLPCEALRGKVVCFWELRALKEEVDYFVIPDGCVDIVINCGKEKEVYLSPTLIKPDVFQLAKKETWFGIRLFPAMASQLFSIHLAELKHQAIELSDIQPNWSRFLEEKLFEAADFEEKIKVVEQFLNQSSSLRNGQIDTRLEGFIQTIYHTHGNVSIADANKYWLIRCFSVIFIRIYNQIFVLLFFRKNLIMCLIENLRGLLHVFSDYTQIQRSPNNRVVSLVKYLDEGVTKN